MRALLDWLAQFVEPYVSYRFLLGLALAAIFFSDLLATLLWLRDLGRAAPDASAREQRLRRIAQKGTLLILAHAISRDTFRRHRALIVQITLLLLVAVAVNILVFTS
jgi:aminoglycoside/choline kinase family phosphotransferase